MSKQHLVLAARETEYVERIVSYIQHSSYGESWQLTAFTNPAALRHYVRAGYSIDLIAAQPSLLVELEGDIAGTSVAALVARHGQCPRYREVLQYQSIPQLMNELTAVHDFYGEQKGGGSGSSLSAIVIAVYSATGGIGKTMLARQISHQAGVRGARVFYLNLEQWNATTLWLGDEGREDLAQMLYTLQAQPDKAAHRLTELRKRHAAMKFDYFAPCSNADERLSLSGEQGRLLLSTIADSGKYDVVIVDLDSRMDPLHQAVFQHCTHLVWMVARDAVIQRKTELALGYCEQKWGTAFKEIKRRIRFVERSGTRSALGAEALPVRLDAVIPSVQEWQEDSMSYERAVPPAYRGAVAALLDRLAIMERGREDGGGNRTAAQSQNS
ncbi:hypothetical protein K0T92_17650 [Paenibacillus oenotherae]|uniref:AAA domain-containing protein n=1 Tax=Paenibacillus oenotherae TaxID=1435645 RepID=A0ABS7D9J1_9BACL|nr:hypothetical protein [Paenibacillus oenotherae]MBW7476545.1 hypothetical protein [Paenibacillus oenotherae]